MHRQQSEQDKLFPSQLRDMISAASPGSSLGPAPSSTCLKHLAQEATSRNLVSHLNWLLSMGRNSSSAQNLSNNQAPHPVSEGEPRDRMIKKNYHHLYTHTYSFGHYLELTTTKWEQEMTGKSKTSLSCLALFTTTDQYSFCITAEAAKHK